MASGISLHLTRGHILLFLSFVVLASVFSYLFYRRRPSGIIGTDWPLAILRGVGLSLLILALFEPFAGLVLGVEQKPLIPVLIDTSGSMSVGDVPPNRLSAALNALDEGLLESLKGKAETTLISFSDVPSIATESLCPVGAVTNIGGSIRDLDGILGRDPSALVLITDGNSNVGENPIDAALEAGFPIYAVGVGDPLPKRDVLVKMVRTNEIGYAGDRIPVEVGIESQGYEGSKTTVSIQERGELLDRKEISLSGTRQEQSVRFEVKPTTPGLHNYRVVVDSVGGELTQDNNAFPFAVRVLKSKINVLVLGRPSWDAKFLMRTISLDENVSMSQLLDLGSGRYILMEGEKEREGRLPSAPVDLAPYDVVVIHSPGAGQIPEDLAKLISNFVSSDGKGVLFLGRVGDISGSLEPLLPVLVSGQLKKQVKFEPTPGGLSHPTTSLHDDIYRSETVWKGLPPILVEDRAVGLKKGASAMAVDPATKTAQGLMPTIAIQRFGRGKTMCILSDQTWRWYFMPVGLGKSSDAYSTLFSNVFRWLVARQEMDRLRVRTDKNIYTSGERITFLAELYDENYRPDDRADVRVSVPTADPVEIPLAAMGRGRYEGTAEALPPGDFTYRAFAYQGEERIAEARGELLVEELTLEFMETRMQEEELKAVAEVTGGEYYPLSGMGLLPGQIELETVVEKKRLEFDLKTSPILFIAIILLFATEWIWRKRRGLA
jgi:hypothetical protein